MVGLGEHRLGRRSAWIAATIVSLFALARLVVPGAANAAEAPRWVITAVTSPTVVAPDSPTNEIQQVSIEATGGEFALRVVPPHSEVEDAETTAELPYDATALEVQEAIAKAGAGTGNVSVSGPVGGPYRVTYEKSLGNYPGTLLEGLSGHLTGGTKAVKVAEVTHGRPDPNVVITATNVGGVATNGSKVTITDALPSGVTAVNVSGNDSFGSPLAAEGEGEDPLECDSTPATAISCSITQPIDTGDQLIIYASVEVAASGLGVTQRASVSGGGAPGVTIEPAFTTGTTPANYGPTPSSIVTALSTQQAGAHADLTTQFTINTSELNTPVADEKDIRFNLPPGIVGSTVGMARCSMSKVVRLIAEPEACPTDTIVGMATLNLVNIGERGPEGAAGTIVTPVFNIAPSPGEPAAFGFDAYLLSVRLDTTVLSNGEYGVQVTAPDLPETLQTFGASITIWGVPAEHNGPGSDESLLTLVGGSTFGGRNTGQTPVPLMTNPQQCTKPLVATMETDSWLERGVFQSAQGEAGMMTGCDFVPFSSSFTFLPDTLEAGKPAGYTFGLNVPQEDTAGTLATSSVKDASVTLPEGVVVNPSAAWGLHACTNEQFYGSNHPSEEPAQLAQCPREAQVGEVEVETPDLERPLKGQVYLGAPECNVCTPEDASDGKMVRLLLQLVGEGEAGIIVKLEGRGMINQATGQITTVFEETPQLPFSRMNLVLEGGPRAVLANPRRCGPVTTHGDLTPWTTGPGVGDSTPSYEFTINQNCFGPQFKPSFTAGMPNIQAGEHGEFTLAFGREDDDQMLKQITLHMPAGLLGTLTGVELCKETQANAGTCGAGSLIGETQVLTGPGANPFLVEGGKVYLTEGYGGSQFGLSIVVPAVAGPYTLGGLNGEGQEADDGKVVVRTQLFIDPHTAQITAVSGALPSMLDGIPLQLKAVNVRLNRPGFMFNPTSCEKMAIAGSIVSQEGMSADVSAPFQVTNCGSLPFKPVFKAATKARHTRKDGAYLRVSVESVQGQADIAYAKVALPKALPSELKTLQHACTEVQFNANPAGCPAESDVGTAEVQTPVVPVPLTGPAYFVSRGAQWPELIMVLQGYGVTVDLAGETHISNGVTTTTLGSVPDVPFTRFSLTLPEKEYSALAGNGNLCAKNLVMPVRFVGQNGKALEQNTQVQVKGCSNVLSVRSHRVKKGMLILGLYVPTAGRIEVSGKGLRTQTKRPGARKVVTLRVHERKAGGLRTKASVVFTPSTGKTRKRQVKVLSVKFKASGRAGKHSHGRK